MADFKVIETQEDFDKMIQKRLEQKEREVAERYKDYLSPDEVGKLKEDFEGKTKGLSEQLKAERDKHVESDKIIAEYKAKAEATEIKLLKNRIAIEKGIPFELSDRLIGSTEEELIKDAESVSALLNHKAAPPMFSNEKNGNQGGNNDTAKYAELLTSLTKNLS